MHAPSPPRRGAYPGPRRAAAVIAERGGAAATLDAVAAAAGFTKGAVCSNFGSKDELVLALLAQLLLVEFGTWAVRDPGAREAFVAFRRDLCARITGVVAAFR